MDAETTANATGSIVTIVVAVLMGGFGKAVLDALVAWVRGRVTREQTGWEKYDVATKQLRRTVETLYETRYGWHKDTGKPFDEMPEVPFSGTDKEDKHE